MNFRHNISTMALTNVQSYLTRLTPEQTESYVRSAMLYYREILFLYRVFKPTNVTSKKEKGGYAVVSVLFSLVSFTRLLSPNFADEAQYISTSNGHQHDARLLWDYRGHSDSIRSGRGPNWGTCSCLFCDEFPNPSYRISTPHMHFYRLSAPCPCTPLGFYQGLRLVL